MASDQTFAGGQSSPLIEPRNHYDRFSIEIIKIGAIVDQDYSEFMVSDIMHGNTHALRKFYKKSEQYGFKSTIINGTSYVGSSHGIEHDFYPMIPLKDDESGAAGVSGWYKMPDDNQKRRNIKKSLDALNMDFEEISKSVIEPENPSETNYKDATHQYNGSPTLQEQYPTLEEYKVAVQDGYFAQTQDIEHITDIFTGIYSTGGTLDEASRTSLYYTLQELLPKITHRGPNLTEDDFPPTNYMFETWTGSGSTSTAPEMVMTTGMTEWTHHIRSGLIVNEWSGKPKYRKRKNNSGHAVFIQIESRAENNTDPIIRTIKGLTPGSAPGPGGTGEPYVNNSTRIDISVQLTVEPPVYGEIRLYDYSTMHVVTRADGRQAQMHSTLLDIPKVFTESYLDHDDVKSNMVYFPHSYKASMELKIFERERFIRETVQISVFSLEVIKTKWYNRSLFRIVLILISLVIAVFNAPAGMAFWKIAVTVAVQLVIATIVSRYVITRIGNPYVAAILAVAIMVGSGLFNAEMAGTTFNPDYFMMIVEATNVYMKKYQAQKLEDLQDEIDEYNEQVKSEMQELDALMEQAGVYRSDAIDWIKRAAQQADSESTEESESRTLDLNRALITSVDQYVDPYDIQEPIW